MTKRLWFGREPALWIQMIAAALAVLAGFAVPGITVVTVALVVSFLNAVAGAYVAWAVRPIQPAIFTGVVSAGVPLLALFGWHLPAETIGALSAMVTAALAVWTRQAVTPAHDPETQATVVPQ